MLVERDGTGPRDGEYTTVYEPTNPPPHFSHHLLNSAPACMLATLTVVSRLVIAPTLIHRQFSSLPNLFPKRYVPTVSSARLTPGITTPLLCHTHLAAPATGKDRLSMRTRFPSSSRSLRASFIRNSVAFSPSSVSNVSGLPTMGRSASCSERSRLTNYRLRFPRLAAFNTCSKLR